MQCIIHIRELPARVIIGLQQEVEAEIDSNMYCYSGTVEEVQHCLDMNCYISLADPITSKNAKEVKEVAKIIPLDRLLIETDAPYLAPHPYRGKRNEPSHVKLVAEEI